MMTSKVLVIAFLISAAAIGIQCQSCAPYDTVPGNGTHTMCLYQPNSGCPKISIKITEQDIKDILHTHNTYRQMVANGQQPNQPGATNMNQLKWSEELATISQRLVDQCKMDHDGNRNTKTYEWVGQNLARYNSPEDFGTAASFPDAIKYWYEEVSLFSSSGINPFVFNENAGHYTAVVWADTLEVGCGYAYYKTDQYYKLYGCNYGPGGNILNGTMYKVGTACTDCPGKCSTTYPGLCNKQ